MICVGEVAPGGLAVRKPSATYSPSMESVARAMLKLDTLQTGALQTGRSAC